MVGKRTYKIAYNFPADNTARVVGYGYMAGKPAKDIQLGDVVYSFIGEKRIVVDVDYSGDMIVVHFRGGGRKVFEPDQVCPVAFRTRREAAKYGHRYRNGNLKKAVMLMLPVL